jgi:hypothetical protein
MSFSKILDFVGSVRLTVVCLFLGMILVFFGTMAQDPLGLYLAQDRYFQSLSVDAASMMAGIKKTLQLFNVYLQPTTAADVMAAPHIPVFPGGYLIGGLLVINLAVSQYRGFQFSKSRIGLYLTHSGLALLLVGQLLTDFLQQESHMRLVEGQPMNYSESSKGSELAILDASVPDSETVTAIPESWLREGKEISHPSLPFKVKVVRFCQNSRLSDRPANATGNPAATQGFGLTLDLQAAPPATRMDERNLPSAIIEIVGPSNPLGTWLVSSAIGEKQPFVFQNKSWQIVMRPARFYKPYSINLLKFSHDKYPGTEIPKNFSSRVEVVNQQTGEKRSVLIYMNNPLRYGGETYYQSSYEGETVSILQVVRNPGYLVPYISCVLVGLGLALHFLISLAAYARGQLKGAPA